MNDKASRNQREGKYAGKYRGIHCRGSSMHRKEFRRTRRDRKADQIFARNWAYDGDDF